MPYRPLLTGARHSESCPQLGYLGYTQFWRMSQQQTQSPKKGGPELKLTLN
jgi:hypothetical protein